MAFTAPLPGSSRIHAGNADEEMRSGLIRSLAGIKFARPSVYGQQVFGEDESDR